MCTDHGQQHDHHLEPAEAAAPNITRRRALQLGAGLGIGALVSRIPGIDLVAPAHAASFDGKKPFSMAMHVHSSFSEGYGSMATHLDQATRNGVDVIWWTDHDFRMRAHRFRKTVHFTSLTSEVGAPGEGGAWAWQRRTAGSLTAASDGGIVTSPASPTDPVVGGSLWLRAQSTSTSQASLGFWADSHPAGWNYQCNLLGQVFTFDVRPTTVGTDAFLELALATSFHPATSGRAAGVYTVVYRVGGPNAPGSRVVNGLTGIVTLAAPSGQWTTLQVTPSDDIALLWPDLQVRDFSSNSITFSAGSRGSVAEGHVDHLRINRPFSTGDIPIDIQDEIIAAYAPKFRSVKQRRGLEMGELLPHISWFGGDLTLADYSSVNSTNHLDFMRQRIATAHASGGLTSYNHPYGYGSGALLPQATQDEQLRELATTLLANRAIGCDIIEVGYQSRAGIDLRHHVGVWDVLSRNAMFITGNGVTDDHAGTNWAGINNNWVTSTWAANRSESNLLAALRAGRAWTSSLSRYQGNLDLVADSVAPMGSVTVSSLTSRRLRVKATSLPADATLQVLRGEVDYAGAGQPTPNLTPIRSFAAGDLVRGRAALNVDTSSECFVRTQVVSSTGAVIAVSNPLWLLRTTPPGGIPAPRAVA